jgi:hypothetical protein
VTLAQHGHLRRDHLGLERSGELLCLCQTEPKVRQARLFITLGTSEFHLDRLSGRQLGH